MEEFTYFEILLLNELVLKEQNKIGKQLYPDVLRCVYKILRPGLFRRFQSLLDLECKLNRWGSEVREKETQEVENND